MSELELKFRIPGAAVKPLRDALRAHGARRLRLRARYFDTADGLLAQHAIALRLRLEGRHWVQTLKAAGEGVAHRLEHEVAVAGSSRDIPALDRHRHAGTEAGQRLDEVLRDTSDAALAERHSTDVDRLHLMLDLPGGTRIEAALDLGSANAGARSSPIVELELEHKSGPVQGLFDFATTWLLHGGLWLCTVTKAERGERLVRGDAGHPATRARPVQLDAHADGPAMLRAMLQSALEHVLANASDLAEGELATDTIHQLRVGLRRLRTVLRELAAISPAISAEWDDALSATFATLGQQRDQDAVATAVRPLLEAASAPVLAWSATDSVDPAAAVREPRFQGALLAILALAHAGADHFAPLPAGPARALVASRLEQLHRQVSRHGGRFEKLAIEQQHRVRKRLKRLRYLAEFSAALWPADKVRRYTKRLGVAQDALGHHNDVGVAAAAFRRDALEHPEAWFSAGYLQAHLAVTAQRAQRALGKVAQGARYWSRP